MSRPENTCQTLRRFPIRLRNLTDLRVYCSLVDSCPFSGYIQYHSRRIPKDDVIALLDCCPSAELVLCVYHESGSSVSNLAELLEQSGLSA